MQNLRQTHSPVDTTISGTINSEEYNMNTINICQLSKSVARERREAIQREVTETLYGIGVVVFILLCLGAESWIERIL